MINQLRPAIVSFGLLTLVTGIVYPAIVSGIGAVAFSERAAGSLIYQGNTVVGSSLIAQPFTGNQYFWPRPSAANYDAAAASGSNLGPTNPALAEAVAERIETIRTADPSITGPMPADLVTTSGSGLDPHLSLSAADAQVSRVSRARGVSETDVRQLIEQQTEQRGLGVLGEPRVNVLQLNIALDELAASLK